ncbi:MAG: rod shape-determining protein RodA [Bacteroidales bacterium]|nr:rod shape-determining protein RodA [Bacteroidales bacterium]
MTQTLDRGLRKTVDWSLVGCWLLLVLIGWINIYASIQSSEPASIFDLRYRCGMQFLWIIVALAMGMVVLFAVNPRLWEVISSPAYLLVLVLLVAVIFLGTEHKGSRSWFSLGSLSFQPAEISKITTSLLLAMVMSQAGFRLSVHRNLLRAALIIGIPALIIVLERETGTALVYAGFLIALYREGMSGWYLFFLGMAVVLFVLTLAAPAWVPFALIAAFLLPYLFFYVRPIRHMRLRRRYLLRSLVAAVAGVVMVFSTEIVFHRLLRDYQRNRIEVVLGLKDDPAGAGYNVRQSMIAIGSGGLFGKGFLRGTQTAYGFVPEQTTDFIFCTVGEEWGFAGCLVVLLLYAFLIGRIIVDADASREAFTRIYGYCVAGLLAMHLLINVGMTVGLVPVIGITLPLMSYGGSSLLAFTLMIFIFIALHRQEKKYF